MSAVVLLAGEGESTRFIYNALSPEFEIAKVVLEARVPRWALLERRLRRQGALAVLGQTLFRVLVVPVLLLEAWARALELRRNLHLSDAPIDPAKIVRVDSANFPAAIALLKELRPSVVVVSGARILSKELLDAVPAPFLNVHAGITPLYRGVHGGYWALARGDPGHCGVTVHIVDDRIDTGPVVFQELIHPTERDNFVTYPLLQLGAGIPLLKRAVADVLAGRLETRPHPAGPSRLWSHPTIIEYLRSRRRGVR